MTRGADEKGDTDREDSKFDKHGFYIGFCFFCEIAEGEDEKLHAPTSYSLVGAWCIWVVYTRAHAHPTTTTNQDVWGDIERPRGIVGGRGRNVREKPNLGL